MQAGTEGSDADLHDLAALQGRWQQVAFEEDGSADTPDSHHASGAITTITGRHFAVHSIAGELLLEGNFLLDASATPRAITWIDAIGADAGKPLPASYRLDGDRFEFIAADVGASRPIAFRTRPGQTMRSFVRCRARA